MKKIALCAGFAAVSLLAGCVKDMPSLQPGGDADKVVGLNVPASFDWKTTKSVDCNFSAAHPSRVFVATERDAEPFASFVAGGGADAVALDVPAAMQTLYVSYETETGVSRPEAVSVANAAAVYSLGANGKLYDGLEDGDKNTTKGNVIHMPSDGWGTLLFEDLWPAYGDYDFNDLVVNYKAQLYMQNKNKVFAMLIGVRVKAVGGSIPYDLCLSMKGVKGGEIDEITLVDKAHAADADLVALNSENRVGEPALLRFENIRRNPNQQPGAAYVNTEAGYEMTEEQLVSALSLFFSAIRLPSRTWLSTCSISLWPLFLAPPPPPVGRPPHRNPYGRIRTHSRRLVRLQGPESHLHPYRQGGRLLLFERPAGLGD